MVSVQNIQTQFIVPAKPEQKLKSSKWQTRSIKLFARSRVIKSHYNLEKEIAITKWH